ncbi:MAG: FAD-dependent oxidoreductase [Halieaceae bacterium]|nr:FAD-dependent oxidoreductase [Halieaceae bacterium]
MNRKQIAVLVAIGVAIALWVSFDLGSYLSFDEIKARMGDFRAFYAEHPWSTGAIYFALYVVVTGLSLPGAAVMTLAGGALFGFWYGLLLVSFASSVGATLACGVSRVLLRDWVQSRFKRQLKSVNAGFERDGAFYLFGLRLVPLFPFFVINLVMGVLPISLWRFYWVSQLGMLAGTAVYVNAGTQLGQLEGLGGILSIDLLLSFALLAVFPLLARGLLNAIKARKALARFQKPGRFDDNMLVIGAGSAGLVAALIAATVRAKVSLVERHKMGGDCLNTGCVPSKALIRSGRIAEYLRRAPEFGLGAVDAQVDFPAVMNRVQSVIAKIEPHDSVERFTSLGVNCISGEAKLVSPWEVEIDGVRRSARNIVIASGARPFVPPVPGLAEQDYLTSDSLWELRELPPRLLVMGAGPIGCELAQAFSRLGSKVTLVDMAPQIMPREDTEVAAHVTEVFRASNIDVLTDHKAVGFRREGDRNIAEFEHAGAGKTLEFDRVLVAVGRKANSEGLGLEELGIETNPNGTLVVDEFLRTSVPTVLACGDIVGPYQFTHMASHQAWYTAVNSLFGFARKFRVDYSVVPWTTFTDPEVARVGINELEAKEQHIPYEVTRYDIDDLDRAIADSEAHGFIKVLTEPGKDRILGVTIVGYHAAELLAEYVLAMKHGIGLNKILGTIHVYPTLSESNKFVAGEWRKARKPEGLLDWVEKLHNWRRGGTPAEAAPQSSH